MITPYQGNEPYIFISYAHRDESVARSFIQLLQRYGYRIWYDDGITPGSDWDDNIAHHIEQSGYFLALLSEAYFASSNCRDELNYARDRERPCLLIYLEPVQLPRGMSMRLSRSQAINRYSYQSDAALMKKVAETEGLEVCLFRRQGTQQSPVQPEDSERRSDKRKSGIERSKKEKGLNIRFLAVEAVILFGLILALLYVRVRSNKPSSDPDSTESIALSDTDEAAEDMAEDDSAEEEAEDGETKNTEETDESGDFGEAADEDASDGSDEVTVIRSEEDAEAITNTDSGKEYHWDFSESLEETGGYTSEVFGDTVIENEAAYFDGDGDYITCGTDLNMTLNWSFHAQICCTDTQKNYASFFAKYGTSMYGPYAFSVNFGYINVWISDGDGDYMELQSSYNLADGEWADIAVVKEGMTVTLYVNGSFQGDAVLDSYIIDSTDTVTIGRQDYLYEPVEYLQFTGYIANLSVYERALSEEEVQTMSGSLAG